MCLLCVLSFVPVHVFTLAKKRKSCLFFCPVTFDFGFFGCFVRFLLIMRKKERKMVFLISCSFLHFSSSLVFSFFDSPSSAVCRLVNNPGLFYLLSFVGSLLLFRNLFFFCIGGRRVT